MDAAAPNANNDVAQCIVDSTPMRFLQKSSGLKAATKVATQLFVWFQTFGGLRSAQQDAAVAGGQGCCGQEERKLKSTQQKRHRAKGIISPFPLILPSKDQESTENAESSDSGVAAIAPSNSQHTLQSVSILFILAIAFTRCSFLFRFTASKVLPKKFGNTQGGSNYGFRVESIKTLDKVLREKEENNPNASPQERENARLCSLSFALMQYREGISYGLDGEFTDIDPHTRFDVIEREFEATAKAEVNDKHSFFWECSFALLLIHYYVGF
jgi:hypothetical protein